MVRTCTMNQYTAAISYYGRTVWAGFCPRLLLSPNHDRAISSVGDVEQASVDPAAPAGPAAILLTSLTLPNVGSVAASSDAGSGRNGGGAKPASFEASSDGKQVYVRGTTGVEVATGVMWFLKYR